MKRRHFIIITVGALLLIGIVWFLFLGKSSWKEASSQPRSETNPPPSSNKTSLAPQTAAEREKQWAKERIEGLRATIERANVPIEFWGKVVDQDGYPLEEVKIVAHSRETYEVVPGRGDIKFPKVQVMTDSAGMFKISGLRGDVLGLDSIEKEGYELSKKSEQIFQYRSSEPGLQYTPDSSQPVIYRMWKKGMAEPLIAHKVEQRIPYDGTPVLFDLTIGKEVSSGGDLKVILTRNPQVIKWGDRNYEWKAKLEAVDGGIIETNDDFMYRAPEGGYESAIKIDMKPNDPKWAMGKRVQFYLKSRGGKHYARVAVNFMTGSDKPKTGFSFTSYLNPTGSRNLEYDPAKEIKPK